eukprot:scaffold51695_cov18-Prasinocladus_malaysianus.AAC.1
MTKVAYADYEHIWSLTSLRCWVAPAAAIMEACCAVGTRLWNVKYVYSTFFTVPHDCQRAVIRFICAMRGQQE